VTGNLTTSGTTPNDITLGRTTGHSSEKET